MTIGKNSLTILLPAGRLPLDIMAKGQELARQHSLEIYLSTAQNLRLVGVTEENAETIKEALAALGADFKAAGKFPLPRVCIGQEYCNLGVIDPEILSKNILDRFAKKEKTKAKFKIAVAGCTMCCSNVKTTDIGIMASRAGFEVFAGGKGGPYPRIGRRIARDADEEQVLEIVENLVNFHDRKTATKQRMYKLLGDADFPYPEV